MSCCIFKLLFDIFACTKFNNGNCKVAKTEMVWERDEIGRPNQSNTTGNSRRRGMPEKSWIDNIAEWTGKSFAET